VNPLHLSEVLFGDLTVRKRTAHIAAQNTRSGCAFCFACGSAKTIHIFPFLDRVKK